MSFLGNVLVTPSREGASTGRIVQVQSLRAPLDLGGNNARVRQSRAGTKWMTARVTIPGAPTTETMRGWTRGEFDGATRTLEVYFWRDELATHQETLQRFLGAHFDRAADAWIVNNKKFQYRFHNNLCKLGCGLWSWTPAAPAILDEKWLWPENGGWRTGDQETVTVQEAWSHGWATAAAAAPVAAPRYVLPRGAAAAAPAPVAGPPKTWRQRQKEYFENKKPVAGAPQKKPQASVLQLDPPSDDDADMEEEEPEEQEEVEVLLPGQAGGGKIGPKFHF